MSSNYNYGITLFLRKFFGLFIVNPEFRFISKIIISLILIGAAFLLIEIL